MLAGKKMGHTFTDDQISKIASSIDKDGDRKVSLQEYTAMIQKGLSMIRK